LSQIVMQKAGGTAFDLLFSFRSEAKWIGRKSW
jgi:hypothetical protein